MKLKIISTGSHGNSYLLENDTEALLIECGVNFKKIKKTIDFNLKKITACILTHEHLDHSKAIKEVLGAGIQVFATEGTHKARGTDSHHRASILEKGKKVKLGNFTVLPFQVEHDAADPVGFLINHPETGNVLFLTDSYYTKYTFKNLNNIIIEANYCPIIAKERMSEQMFLHDRVLQSHMSIDQCLNTLSANDLSKVNNIVLIHLSDRNSHEEEFVKKVTEATGKTVVAGRDNMILEFNETPF